MVSLQVLLFPGRGGLTVIEDFAYLGANHLWTDDALVFHGVDEAGGAGIAHAQASLEHGDAGATFAADELNSFAEHGVSAGAFRIPKEGTLLEWNADGEAGIHDELLGEGGTCRRRS